MKVTTFATIEIASYEVSMKIYALSPKTMKEINNVRHRMELGGEKDRIIVACFEQLCCKCLYNIDKNGGILC